MTRSKKLIAVLLAAVFVFGMAGCDQTGDANAAISAANTKSQKYTALDDEISVLLDDASAVSMTPEGVLPGIEALDAASAKYAERKVVIGEIKAEFEKIASYKVSDEIKTYATQQVEIAGLLAQMDDLGIKLIADTKTFYELIKAGSSGTSDEAMDADAAKAEELSAAIEETSAKLTELDALVTEKEQASDKYFTDQGLGE